MQYERKRTLSFIVVGGYLFLGGCEYAIILPTCLSYLKTLGVTQEYWLGFAVSAYSFSAAISGIIGGRLSDKYEHRTKTIAMISIVLMIFGSFQYTVGLSVWNVLVSRLICGCGTAAGSAMLADVCRVTSVDERTPILALCNATRQLGILVGPVFQLVLTYFHFHIGSFEVTPLNAPGIFMGFLWIIFSVMTYFMFYNLSAELKIVKRQQRLRNNAPPLVVSQPGQDCPPIPETGPSIGHQFVAQRAISDWSPDQGSIHASGLLESSNFHSVAKRQRTLSMSERFMNSLAQSGQKSTTGMMSLLASGISTYTDAGDREGRSYLKEFLKDYFILMLSMVFTLFFCQVGVETIVPVVMQDYFNYTEFENSLVYMAGGAEALVVFFSVALLSRYIRDTNLMIVGWFAFTVGHIWLLVFLPQFQATGTGSALEVVIFMIGLVMLYFGYAVASVANTGLFSKCLGPHTQGLGQGLRRMVSYMGLIFGPTWAGATVRKPYHFLGVPLAIVALHALMLIDSFRDLRAIENEHREMRDSPPTAGVNSVGVIPEEDEERPLLRR